MTGPELIEMVEAFFTRHPEVSRTRFACAARGRNGLNDLKDVKNVKPVTIAKIQAMMENPSAYAYLEQQSSYYDEFDVAERAKAKRAASIRRTLMKKAAAYVDGDKSVLSAGGGVRQDIAGAAKWVLEQRASAERQRDPVERAKLLLQRRFRPVCSMAVYGGSKNLFVVGTRRNVTEGELLSLAKKIAA